METVDCQVSIMIRPGETRAQIVTVEEDAIRKKCWKPIACIRAAALMELPFTLLLDKARFGFRKDDKERLFGKTAGEQGAGNREPGTGNRGRWDGGRPVTAPTWRTLCAATEKRAGSDAKLGPALQETAGRG